MRYESEYSKEDKYIVMNKNDRSLRPFVIFLPKLPKNIKPAGYGKPADKQVFTKTQAPSELGQLEKSCKADITSSKTVKFTSQRLIAKIWEELTDNRTKYIKAIDFIREEITRVRDGYWFYNNGKPIYIPGAYYFYLNYWVLDDGITPDFRIRDLEWFLAVEHAATTTIDHEFNDFKVRTLMGILYPKHRRDGATHKSLAYMYSRIIYHHGDNIGAIQSLDKADAEAAFSKLTMAFKYMPFWFKPMWNGVSDEPSEKIDFHVPSYLSHLSSLDNRIEHATTSHRSYFDGRKTLVFLVDEGGKTIGEKVDERHEVVKRCALVGNNIHGVLLYPSTTADMEAENGQLFYNMAKNSMYHDRNKTTGQTITGLITIFSPACYGTHGFINIFGESVVSDPLEKDKWKLKSPDKWATDSNGKLLGARRFYMDRRRQLLEKGDEDSMRLYLQEIKLAPMEFLESFAGASGGQGFDVHKIKTSITRIEYNRENESGVGGFGNFAWRINGADITASEFIEMGYHLEHGITNKAKVVWLPNKDGRFFVTKHPKINNARYMSDGVWYTDSTSHIASADSFTWLKKGQTATKKAGFSLGSGAVFERLNKEDKSLGIESYKSHNFVCDYLFRPPTVEEYLEEMLMMSVYYGTIMYPESNIQNIEEWFVKRGFGGFLLYATSSNGRKKDRAGFYSREISQDTLVKQLRSYFQLHSHRENHDRILKGALLFHGVESLTDIDILVSAGGCLLGDIEMSKYEMFDNQDSSGEESKEKFFNYYYIK